jgi:hypothetical protein
MTCLLLAFLSWFGAFLRSRHDLGLELIALRHQATVVKMDERAGSREAGNRRRLASFLSVILKVVR